MVWSHSSTVMFSTGAVGPAMPALLTSTSKPPRKAPAASKSASTASGDDTSAIMAPAFGHSREKRSSASASTSQM